MKTLRNLNLNLDEYSWTVLYEAVAKAHGEPQGPRRRWAYANLKDLIGTWESHETKTEGRG